MQKSLLTAFALLLLLTTVAAVSEETVHHDTDFGFQVAVPAGEGWTCGVGAYGLGYDTQFGCKGPMFNLLILPSESGGGGFSLNVQASIVQGGSSEILALLVKALADNGYQEIENRSADGAQRSERIGFAAEKRTLWYLLQGERLLEVNARFASDYREGEARGTANAALARIVESIRFDAR